MKLMGTTIVHPVGSVVGPAVALTTIALMLALGCGGAEAPAEHADDAETTVEYPDALEADPDHYSVEFENDAVRLLRINYGAGETSVMHRHPANCAIALGDASWRMTDTEGNVTDDTATLGDIDCESATIHLPENSGSQAGQLILVELKEGATAGTDAMPEHPDAVAADPDHYSVEFENDAVRLLRIRYEAGETSVMHHHPANCVIFVRDQSATFELPSGEVVEAPAGETGLVRCGDAEAHLPTNTGDDQLEVVLVELKGRASAGG